jgi:hypothetical protein
MAGWNNIVKTTTRRGCHANLPWQPVHHTQRCHRDIANKEKMKRDEVQVIGTRQSKNLRFEQIEQETCFMYG